MSAANGGTGQPSDGPRPPRPVSATPTAASAAVNSASGSTTSTAGGSLKRVKSGLSCAECRRSKLKCDRSFPCQSCIRRGCAAICPDGTLTATKGNKVLMAHAERLTQQVKAMSARIKELEQALAMAQGSSAHPLLLDADPRDGHAIVSELEGAFAAEMEEVSDAIGSLSIGTDGKTKYFGETASSEYLQNLIQESSDPAHMSNPKFLGLPPDIIELVKAYPFGMRDSACTTEVFKQFIPPRDRTETVAALFYTNASWLYDPVPRDEFNNLIRDPIYRAVDGYLPFKSIPAHNFSIFFMILASGLIFSPSQSAPILMEQYHALARAAFSLDSITRGASTASVQAMIMTIYYSYWTDRNGTEVRWLYNGLCVRIAQMIGLQRDSAGWNLDKDEVQRRRTAFWEFYTWDAWSSVITGRPPVLNIAQADCRFPDDTETVVNARGQVDSGWHRWKYMYNVNCLTPSVQRTFSVRPLQYSTLLELDKRIRNFPLPPEHFRPGTEDGRGWSSDPRRAMTQHCSTVLRESNLMYLHRSYFAQAIRESTDPLQHKYGQSVITAYQSTRALISSLRGVFAAHPTLVGKIWWFWSGIFSSCVILGAVVVECPGCKLAESALADLDAAIAFFELGSAPSRAARTMSMLQNFYQRAHEAYNEYRRQIQAGNGPVTTPPKDRHGLDNPDELEVLGGRKTLVNQAGAARSPSSSSSTRSSPEVNQGPYAQQRLSPPAVSVTSSGYYQPHPQQQLLAPIVTEGLQVPSGHVQSYDYGWDTSPVSAPGVFVYSPQGAMQIDQPHQQQHRHPFADYHAGYGQPPSQQQPPPGQNVYSTGQLSGPSAHMQGSQGSAGMGFQEDIWQDFVQHLGMRTE